MFRSNMTDFSLVFIIARYLEQGNLTFKNFMLLRSLYVGFFVGPTLSIISLRNLSTKSGLVDNS